MKFRNVVASFLGSGFAANATPPERYDTVVAGDWELDVPSSWKSKVRADGMVYLESEDGSKGCYVRAVTFRIAFKNAQSAATSEIVEVERMAPPSWTTVSRVVMALSGKAYASLDMVDRPNNYRVLAVVLAKPESVLSVHIHDYRCENYTASKKQFDIVVESLREKDHPRTAHLTVQDRSRSR
jgi:hypothetical protein